MFGTRNLVLQSQSNITSIREKESPHISFLRRLFQQSKQISQIVAFIWRWADDPKDSEKSQAAKKLKKYFEHPTLDGVEIDGQLKKLFKVIPDPNGNEEARLLSTVFSLQNNSSLIFPIFDSFELGEEDAKLGYAFIIDIEHYYGEIQDPTKNHPNLLTFKIPYPPRPQLGELTVTHQELESWTKNISPSEYFSDNVYIPSSSC
jgi:hypothetical protein